MATAPRTPLGALLRARRTGLGLSQVAVAERLGVDQVEVSRYEVGERIPAFDRLVTLCSILGVTIEDLAQARSAA